MFHVFLQQVEKGCDRCYSLLGWVWAAGRWYTAACRALRWYTACGAAGKSHGRRDDDPSTVNCEIWHWICNTLCALLWRGSVWNREGRGRGGGTRWWWGIVAKQGGVPPISKQGHPPISRGDADQNDPFLASPLHPRTFHSMHLWRLKPQLDLIFFGRIRPAIKMETAPKNLFKLYLPWNSEIWRGNTTRKLCCYLQSSMNEHNIKVLVVCIGILAAVGDINAR